MVKRLTLMTPERWGFGLLRLALLLCVFLATAGNAYADDDIKKFDSSEAARVLWSTFLAIEQANDTLNYSVFREIAAPEFQRKNTTEDIAELFYGLRKSGVDLSRALLLQPEYEIAPQIGATGLLRMRGKFAMPPEVVNFDLLYQMIYGEWRLLGVAVVTGMEEAKIEKRRFWFRK
ncbi:hypothetical protein [Zhongshania sp. BJYM1]|jgi:hypothetical protein|uniref:hypothetical protein n=1 Tax=Zhongshania aquatica TaxID=2965069 RepID=UPI0022B53288|nr:hypothetical protein [Marortus sp. BJYM1]